MMLRTLGWQMHASASRQYPFSAFATVVVCVQDSSQGIKEFPDVEFPK